MESGDESVAPTPKGSANSGFDAGTDYGEDEDVEVTASPGTWLLYLLAFSCSVFFSQRHLRRSQWEEVVGGAGGAERRAREGEALIPLAEWRSGNDDPFDLAQLRVRKHIQI
jgi:hypothetical protein